MFKEHSIIMKATDGRSEAVRLLRTGKPPQGIALEGTKPQTRKGTTQCNQNRNRNHRASPRPYTGVWASPRFMIGKRQVAHHEPTQSI
jgi:hypothetical protein